MTSNKRTTLQILNFERVSMENHLNIICLILIIFFTFLSNYFIKTTEIAVEKKFISMKESTFNYYAAPQKF